LLKRTFDILPILISALLFLPVFILVPLIIRSKLGSPIFFKQSRPGLNGRILGMLKFRTMTNECNEDGDLLSDDMKIRCQKLNKEFFSIEKNIAQWIGLNI